MNRRSSKPKCGVGVVRSLGAVCLLLIAAGLGSAQDKCLEADKLDQIRSQIRSGPPAAENKPLAEEFIRTATDLSAAIRKTTIELRGNEEAAKALASLEKEAAARICSTLNRQGWPTKAAVGAGGASAFLFTVSKALPVRMQLELYPLVSEAFDKGEIDGGEVLASYVDRLRLAIGHKQLYGSQVFVRDGFLVMAPIERPGQVDKRRSEFNLGTLRSYERFLEVSYQMPLIRSVMEPVRAEDTSGTGGNASLSPSGLGAETDGEPITVETAFVSVDVIIPDAVGNGSASLEKNDFRLLDNGRPVEIESFAKADAPFDIVLLLDLSGSTADKVGLIKKTTRRFAEMKRPGDRVAVVAFHDMQTIVSELEGDKEVLLKRIKKIDGYGASYVWDAIGFGLDMLERSSEKGRRKAIVIMSDGADNSLSFQTRLGSRMSFADLVEKVQRGNAAIFPIYLDTEGRDAISKRIAADARRTMEYIAEQSAGNMYTANKLEDVAGLYDQVLKDVGTVYSLGFTPDVKPEDPKYRTLRVEVTSRPGLKLKHRPGYFTK